MKEERYFAVKRVTKRRKTKVEKITEQIAILFREIRSLELELSRTDPHELVDDADQKLEP